MARVRVITRTINQYNYECLCVDVPTKKTVINVLPLTGDPINDEKALKALQKIYNSDTLKVVMIVSKETKETIYGMLETDFIRLAKPMDSDRHFVGDDSDVEIEPTED